MQHIPRLAFLLTLTAALAPLRAEEPDDQTLAPYFTVLSETASAEALPLKSTDVRAAISGVVADVTVTQTYANNGDTPIEALYVFPASTRAAVHGLQMTIGDRVIEAQIQERQAAQATYAAAKAEGKSATLLEQQRPNVFQMSVAHILPGDEIRVVLRYTEFLEPTDRVYAFVFPAVVGPRYSRPKSVGPGAESWLANPYLPEGTPPPSAFSLSVQLEAGLPLQEVRCDSHPVKIDYRSKTSATIALQPGDRPAGDRDFILHYRLAGKKTASGLLIHQGENENFFLLMVQPPARLAPTEMPPREYVFVIDVSGSMSGFPLDTAKSLIRQLAGGLRPADRFNVILFASSASQLADRSLPATRENIDRALDLIDRQPGGGGTELTQGLEKAFALPGEEDVSRSIVVLTDGFISFETETFDLIRARLGRANLFAFGIGSSVNRFLIEGMAHAGQGEPFVVTHPDQAAATAARFARYISRPALTGLTLTFDGVKARDLEPPTLPDVFADRPVVAFGKFEGAPAGKITLRGRSGTGDFEQTLELAAATGSNPALPYLWARKRIQRLDDYNQLRSDPERVREVTSLGLTYHLLTARTSFVAVDSVVRNPGGAQNSESVKQPLALPQGVSNSAIGSVIPTTPEPEEWMIVLALAAVIAWSVLRRKKSCRP